MKVFFDHKILFWTYDELIKLKNPNLNQIADSTNNLV